MSPAGAGFFFVGKKYGGLRPCIDYRGLNAITVKNHYPLPLVNSAFERFQGASVFSVMHTIWCESGRGTNGRLHLIPTVVTMNIG